MQILIRVSIHRALPGAGGQVPAAAFENGEGGAEPSAPILVIVGYEFF